MLFDCASRAMLLTTWHFASFVTVKDLSLAPSRSFCQKFHLEAELKNRLLQSATRQFVFVFTMSSFEPATLYYWPIKARNYHCQVIAKAGGIPLNLETNFDMATLKPTLPFGQLPYLVDGDVKLAQSNAIFRYLAKKGNQQGDTPAAYADSEMMTEEANDILNLLTKAYYGPNRAQDLDNLFAAGSSL